MVRVVRGFTLVEVMLALVLAGLVLLGGTTLLTQAEDMRDRMARQAQEGDREFNGNRLLRRLVLNAEVTADSSERFTGDARAVSFMTACPTPGGWLERCRVALGLDARRDSTAMIAELRPGETLVLRRWMGTWRFAYLDRISGDRRWLASWGTSIALPAAIGIVSELDTIVMPIGAASR